MPANKPPAARRRTIARSGRYVVANPRNIPKGRHILATSNGEHHYEGDKVTLSSDNADVESLLRQGVITKE